MTGSADAVGIIDLEVEGKVASSRDNWLTLLYLSTFCSFFPTLPGVVLAILGFVMRRTRLAAIILAVAAAPWVLFALLYLVIYLFSPELLV